MSMIQRNYTTFFNRYKDVTKDNMCGIVLLAPRTKALLDANINFRPMAMGWCKRISIRHSCFRFFSVIIDVLSKCRFHFHNTWMVIWAYYVDHWHHQQSTIADVNPDWTTINTTQWPINILHFLIIKLYIFTLNIHQI